MNSTDKHTEMMQHIYEQLGITPDRQEMVKFIAVRLKETANDLIPQYGGPGMTEEELREHYANQHGFKAASVVVFHISQEDAFK